jgi:hypothetical protein
MRPHLIPLAMSLLMACSGASDGADDPSDDPLPEILATVETSGRDQDDSVTVVFCRGSSDYSCQLRDASANGDVTFSSLEPGDYSLFLQGVSENCSVTGDWFVTVQLRDTNASVGFAIHCRGPGTVRVSAVTSGTNQDASYTVLGPSACDDYYVPCDRRPLSASGTVQFDASPGARTFLLEDVAGNCAVAAPGTLATVMVKESEVVELRYEVACE